MLSNAILVGQKLMLPGEIKEAGSMGVCIFGVNAQQ